MNCAVGFNYFIKLESAPGVRVGELVFIYKRRSQLLISPRVLFVKVAFRWSASDFILGKFVIDSLWAQFCRRPILRYYEEAIPLGY